MIPATRIGKPTYVVILFTNRTITESDEVDMLKSCSTVTGICSESEVTSERDNEFNQ
jgi:hypothetical protein